MYFASSKNQIYVFFQVDGSYILFTSKYVQANFINQESNFTTIRTNFECMIYQLLVLIIKYKIYLFIHAYGVLFVFCGNRVKEN
jgi:hypothetical protein